MKNLVLISVVIIVSLSSCLKLQVQEKYNGKRIDINQNMSCWEYLQSNEEEFKSMIEAISMTGLENCYKQNTEEYTFLLLTNKAISSYVSGVKSNPTKENLLKLKAVLLFHIIRGAYNAYVNLNYNVTYVDTLLEGDELMSIVLQSEFTSKRTIDRVQLMVDCGSSEVITATRSNLVMTNGVAHVIDKRCVYIE